jgi:hypothetical protein
VTGILGGRIRVQSIPGAGTSFIIAMPSAAPWKPVEDESLSMQHTLS